MWWRHGCHWNNLRTCVYGRITWRDVTTETVRVICVIIRSVRGLVRICRVITLFIHIHTMYCPALSITFPIINSLMRVHNSLPRHISSHLNKTTCWSPGLIYKVTGNCAKLRINKFILCSGILIWYSHLMSQCLNQFSRGYLYTRPLRTHVLRISLGPNM